MRWLFLVYHQIKWSFNEGQARFIIFRWIFVFIRSTPSRRSTIQYIYYKSEGLAHYYNFPSVSTSIPGPGWLAWYPPSLYGWFSLKAAIAAIERNVLGSHIAIFANTFLLSWIWHLAKVSCKLYALYLMKKIQHIVVISFADVILQMTFYILHQSLKLTHSHKKLPLFEYYTIPWNRLETPVFPTLQFVIVFALPWWLLSSNFFFCQTDERYSSKLCAEMLFQHNIHLFLKSNR